MTGWQLCSSLPRLRYFLQNTFFGVKILFFSLSEYCFWFLKVGISGSRPSLSIGPTFSIFCELKFSLVPNFQYFVGSTLLWFHINSFNILLILLLNLLDSVPLCSVSYLCENYYNVYFLFESSICINYTSSVLCWFNYGLVPYLQNYGRFTP